MRDLRAVSKAMARLGYQLSSSEHGTMDSGEVRFTNGIIEIFVWKDRSQWMIKDSRKILEQMGLWQAYDDISAFCDALVRYAKAKNGEAGFGSQSPEKK